MHGFSCSSFATTLVSCGSVLADAPLCRRDLFSGALTPAHTGVCSGQSNMQFTMDQLSNAGPYAPAEDFNLSAEVFAAARLWLDNGSITACRAFDWAWRAAGDALGSDIRKKKFTNKIVTHNKWFQY